MRSGCDPGPPWMNADQVSAAIGAGAAGTAGAAGNDGAWPGTLGKTGTDEDGWACPELEITEAASTSLWSNAIPVAATAIPPAARWAIDCAMSNSRPVAHAVNDPATAVDTWSGAAGWHSEQEGACPAASPCNSRPWAARAGGSNEMLTTPSPFPVPPQPDGPHTREVRSAPQRRSRGRCRRQRPRIPSDDCAISARAPEPRR